MGKIQILKYLILITLKIIYLCMARVIMMLQYKCAEQLLTTNELLLWVARNNNRKDNETCNGCTLFNCENNVFKYASQLKKENNERASKHQQTTLQKAVANEWTARRRVTGIECTFGYV